MSSPLKSGHQIRILPQEVIEQIAAGEVVERPASVVKELVENALDAGATSIAVAIEGGGKRLIRVTDNGCGMTREELPLALQRHATSKLRTTSDLFTLTTLGFRGEALPSIAAVSRMEIRSRPPTESEGTVARVEGGALLACEPIGTPPGTSVTVCDLYFNVPARLKFLRSPATEEAHILDLVGKLALASPAVRFEVVKGDRQLLLAPAGGDRLTRLALLHPHLSPAGFLPVDAADRGMRLTGYIARPAGAKGTRPATSLFVNGRAVRAGMVAQAVLEGYRHFLAPRVHPPAFLFLEIPGEAVDVNVHPTKAEVRFTAPQEIFRFVEGTISRTLNENVEELGARVPIPAEDPTADFPARAGGAGWLFEPRGTYEAPPIHEAPPSKLPSNGAPEVIPIGELARTYLIFQDHEALYLVDQHQAHERSTYELLKRRLGDPTATPVQPLLFPMTLDVSPAHRSLLDKHGDLLAAMGFQVDPFGGNTILIRSIPHGLDRLSNKEALLAFLEDLAEHDRIKEAEVIQDKIITSLACKSSIKAGDELTREERMALWKRLMQTENPYLCPHGRPVMITLSLDELHRLFKRK